MLFFNTSIKYTPKFQSDVSINLSHTFCGCKNLIEVRSDFNPININNGLALFHECSSLVHYPTHLDFSKSKKLDSIFRLCSSLIDCPEIINAENTNSVGSMFAYTKITKTPKIITKENVNAYGVFSHCTEIRDCHPEFSIENFSNTCDIFTDCPKLEHVSDNTLRSEFSTDSRFMFYNCSNLRQLPNIDLPNASTDALFYNCKNLSSIGTINIPKATGLVGMFYNCSSLTQRMDPKLYWGNPNITAYANCFKGAVNIENYNDIPQSWK